MQQPKPSDFTKKSHRHIVEPHQTTHKYAPLFSASQPASNHSIIIMPKKQSSRSNQSAPAEPSPATEAPKKQETGHFTLYDLLEVGKQASKDEIKKQYRKLVLQYHPDKNKEDPQAREKFQKLKEAYDILIDDEKRKQYDQTGHVGDDFNEKTFQSAYEYFRTIYKKVTKHDIESFEKQYREGAMEQQDLINYYHQHEGSMVELIESICLSRNEDIPRFIAFFEEQIQSGALPRYKAFDKTKKKVRLLKDEEKEWEEQQRKKQSEAKRDMSSLVLAIQKKAANQADFIASLEEKYGVGKKRKIQKEARSKK